MLTEQQLSKLFSSLNQFAAKHPDIKAIGLIGSYARGSARQDSDIDLILLVNDPRKYLEDTGWVDHFGKSQDMDIERHGMSTSLRVWYEHGPEMEFGFSTPAWANLPIDPGVARTVRDGINIVHDPRGILTKLIGTAKDF